MSGVLQLALKHLDELSQAKGVPVERSRGVFHETLANGVPAERMERSGTNRADGTPDHTPAPPETGTVTTDRADKRASVSSVSGSGQRHGTEATAPSAAALRMRRHRERRRDELRCLTIELRENEITALIRKGFLNEEARNNRRAVISAFYGFLDGTLDS
jgi:hypothetical protein